MMQEFRFYDVILHYFIINENSHLYMFLQFKPSGTLMDNSLCF